MDHGHHAAFDLEWFRRIGGYDPTFSHNEDAEYDRRLRVAGGRIWLDARIRLSYVMRATLKSLCRQYLNYGRGRARTIFKHRMRPRTRQIVPAVNVVFLALSGAIGLAWAPAFLGLVAYVGLLIGSSLVCAVRLGSTAGLLAGPALGAMHLSWGLGFLWQLGAELVSFQYGSKSNPALRPCIRDAQLRAMSRVGEGRFDIDSSEPLGSETRA